MNCVKDGKYTGDSCFGCPVKVNECEIRDKVYRKRWIPVAERLPDVAIPVLITLWNKDVTIGTWYGHRWGTVLCYNEDVRAWMPLPEPFSPQN